jgi:hypothetical protein
MELSQNSGGLRGARGSILGRGLVSRLLTTYYWDTPEALPPTLEKLPGIWAFSDGGIVGKNNNVSRGIVGAFRVIENGEVVHSGSYIETIGHPSYTSNHSEAWAAMIAVEQVKLIYGDSVPFNLVLDSGVTWQRIQGERLNLMPGWDGETKENIYRYRKTFSAEFTNLLTLTLVSGHPSKKMLKDAGTAMCGWYTGKNRVWHRHNIWCDDACKAQKLILEENHVSDSPAGGTVPGESSVHHPS